MAASSMTNADRVLACVEHVHKGNRGFSPEFVRLVPVARWDDEWVRVEDPLEEFPGEGLIFWPRPKGHRFEDGQAWIVEVEFRGGGEDHYWVRAGARATRPWEAVTVPEADDIVALRRALAADRFPLAPSPAGLALVAHPARRGLWLAPFDAVRDRSGHQHGFASGWSRLLRIDPARLFDMHLSGVERQLYDPTGDAPEQVGTFIVQRDDQLVTSAARRLKRWDKDALAALGTTQALVEAHAAHLARALDTEAAGQNAARDEALGALLAAGTLAAEAAQDLATTVALHPLVSAEIEARVSIDVAARRRELDAEFEGRRAELEAASSAAVAAEEARLATLAEERARIEQAIGSLESELRHAVDRQIAAGVPGLADSLVARVLLHPGASAPRAVGGGDEARPRRSVPEVDSLMTIRDLRAAIMARAAYDRVDSLLAVTAAGLLLARGVVMMTGAAAAALATTVAMALAGPHVLRIAISPTVFALGDLLALPVATANDAMSLGEALTRAADDDEPAVLILDGANRAPLEGALTDLLDRVDRRGGRAAWRSPDGTDVVARLDGRLLVIATLTGGTTTFAIPEGVGARVPLLDADRTPFEEDVETVELRRATRIAPALFDELAGLAATPEQIMRWRRTFPVVERTAIIARYLAVMAAILPGNMGETEARVAMASGRRDLDPASVAVSGNGWPTDIDAADHHRRLAALFDKEPKR